MPAILYHYTQETGLGHSAAGAASAQSHLQHGHVLPVGTSPPTHVTGLLFSPLASSIWRCKIMNGNKEYQNRFTEE
jgi:hypothetical protein